MARKATTKRKPAARKPAAKKTAARRAAPKRLERRAAVKALLGKSDDFLIVGGLGGASNDVLAVTGDKPNAYPLSGAMGAAAIMGLGLALAQPNKRVLVVTGDGDLLMNVGSLAAIGVMNPPNLSIVCVDNEHYGETGFQVSHTGRGTDLEQMAVGAGITATRTVTEKSELADAARLIRQSNGTSFVLLKVAPDDPEKVARIRDASVVKSKFREALLGTV